MSEHEISVSIPLDNDGFLRRECPTCEREFKWLPSDNSYEPEPGGYFCPYCQIQADTDHWLTKPQAEYVGAIGLREVAGPLLDDLDRSMRRMGGSVKRDLPDEPAELTEDDDMRRVDFACHPDEPVKVLDEWAKPVHCLICGQPATA